MGIVSVSLPDVLLDRMDAFIERRGFAGRSEVVRAALRDFLADEPGGEERAGVRSATLTLLYPEGYERKIGSIRHDFSDIVLSMMHSHTDAFCVEVFVLRGSGARIRAFGDALRALRETELVSATWTDVRREAAAPPHAHAHAHAHDHAKPPGKR